MFYDEFIKLCNSVEKSPTAVAKEMGLAGAHVTKWKNGSTPTDATIFKVCDYFGVSHTYFSETEKAPTTEGERKLSEDELMAAFFNGGADGLSREEMAEMWEDAREYIQYKLAQRRRKNNV